MDEQVAVCSPTVASQEESHAARRRNTRELRIPGMARLQSHLAEHGHHAANIGLGWLLGGTSRRQNSTITSCSVAMVTASATNSQQSSIHSRARHRMHLRLCSLVLAHCSHSHSCLSQSRQRQARTAWPHKPPIMTTTQATVWHSRSTLPPTWATRTSTRR